MRNLLLLLTVLVGVEFSQAAPVRRLYQDVKLPTQNVIEKQTFTDVAASNMSTIVSYAAGATSAAAASLTTFDDSTPDVPRTVSITPKGTTGDIESCVITVTGTDIFNDTITETFTFAADETTKKIGVRAFKSITSVAWPASCESGGFAATWHVGTENALGIQRCMANKGDVIKGLAAGLTESTDPTMVVHSTSVSSNTADFDTAYDGSVDFILHYIQNFRCFP